MRVLFVSASPLQKELSIGNTFLNLFSDFDDVEMASICTKSGVPDEKITQCFCITEKMLIRNLLKKGHAGKILDLKRIRQENGTKFNALAPENTKGMRFIKTQRWSIFFWIQNLIWQVGKWKSKELKTFIEEFQPDVVFTLLSDKKFLNRLILYVFQIANAKKIVYAWDNNYSLKRLSFSPFDWISHLTNRRYMRKVVAETDVLYVISDVQKADYEKAFKKPCSVITKAADFSQDAPLKASYGDPLQLVYTGNINGNRWKTLNLIARSLKMINKTDIKAELRIYTGSFVTKKMEKALNIDRCSYIMGSVSASEVLNIQREADILVHAEALDLKNKLAVRQSFSTKLVDYMKSARPIFAVGPKDVASVKYFIDHDCAMVASSAGEVYEELLTYINDHDELSALAQKSYDCGKNNCSRDRIISGLKKDLMIK